MKWTCKLVIRVKLDQLDALYKMSSSPISAYWRLVDNPCDCRFYILGVAQTCEEKAAIVDKWPMNSFLGRPRDINPCVDMDDRDYAWVHIQLETDASNIIKEKRSG